MNRRISDIRRLTRHAAIAAALLAGSAALGGCFTGVESTPRITDADVRRDAAATRPEETYLSDIRREPFGAWKPGKRFVVTDSKIALVFNSIAAGKGPAAGSHIEYVGSRPSSDIAGNPTTDLIFTDSVGMRYVHTVAQRADSLEGRRLEIPFTIDLAMIERVAQRIKGQTFFVMTPNWYDSHGQSMRERKFIPVMVTDVRPGTTVNPVAVSILAPDGAAGTLMMNIDNRSRNPRSFGNLFSFTDPRKKYPAITDEVWLCIVNGIVRTGMTRDECRLSLGSPLEVVRNPGYSYLHESWRYDNGVYLIFEDGILRSFKR